MEEKFDFEKIEIQIMDRNAPGFMIRMRESVRFKQVAKDIKDGKEVNIEDIDKMIEFITSFVTNPVDRKKARELVEIASQAQIEIILDKISQTGQSEESDPTKKPEDIKN